MDKFDRKIVVAVTLILFYLFIGTIFYHLAEGWGYVDSFYFSGTTLTTVGYGDLSPTHDLTKIVTVLFMFSGIGIVLYSISIIGQKYFEREEERLQKIWEATQERRANLKEDIRDANPAQHIKRVAKRLTSFDKETMLRSVNGKEEPHFKPPKIPTVLKKE